MTEALLQSVIRWAESRPEVRAVVLTGSHAREDDKVDELSDLDVELFLQQPEAFTRSVDWLSEIGTVWVCLPLQNTEGYHARLVIFQGGFKVDFQLYPLEVLRRRAESRALSDLYRRGFRVLVDKDGLAALIPKPRAGARSKSKPSEEQFRALVEEFWFEAYHVAKYLRREDLWAAKARDWGTKELLRTMIEWHTKSSHGWAYDTWHLGVNMKRWATPPVWARLSSVFGHFGAPDAWRALSDTMAMFSELARDVAVRLHYTYPEDVEENLRAYIDSLRP